MAKTLKTSKYEIGCIRKPDGTPYPGYPWFVQTKKGKKAVAQYATQEEAEAALSDLIGQE